MTNLNLWSNFPEGLVVLGLGIVWACLLYVLGVSRFKEKSIKIDYKQHDLDSERIEHRLNLIRRHAADVRRPRSEKDIEIFGNPQELD